MSSLVDGIHANLTDLLVVLQVDVVMLIHDYFDESGTHNSAMCVAGYLFELDQLLKLDEEWTGVLSDAGLRHFYMSDCAHGTKDFERIAKSRRSDIARRLIGIIKRRARIGIVVSVVNSQFDMFTMRSAGEGRLSGMSVIVSR